MTPAPWYDNHAKVELLCNYLREFLDYDDVDLSRVRSKPWHWESEFKEAETRRLVQYS